MIGVQIMISCAFSVTDYEDKNSSSSNTQGEISSSSGVSSCSSGGTGNSSSSTAGNSNSSSSAGGSSPSSSGGTDNSSSSTAGGSAGSNSSSSRVGGSSSSIGGNLSSAIYNGDDFCDANPPEQPDPPVFDSPFVDIRNDKRYETVKIGNQIWMAENLNYKASGSRCYASATDDMFPNTVQELGLLMSDAAEQNCDKYGRLYDWAAARTACPSGWKLPTRDDWNKLKDFVEDEVFQNCEDYWFDWDVATRLKATSGWKNNGNGRDYYGFKAIGGGFCVSCNTSKLTSGSGYFSGVEMNYKKGDAPSTFNPALNISVNSSWWSDTQHNASDAFAYEMTNDKQVMNEKRHAKTEYLLSVRCIKN